MDAHLAAPKIMTSWYTPAAQISSNGAPLGLKSSVLVGKTTCSANIKKTKEINKTKEIKTTKERRPRPKEGLPDARRPRPKEGSAGRIWGALDRKRGTKQGGLDPSNRMTERA